MPGPGRFTLAVLCLAAVATLLAAGCGRSDPATPVACLEGAPAYLKALAAAPGEVTIGDCLDENQDAGDLSRVGEAMIEAATRLNAKARETGGGPAATQLGYLVGAVEGRSEETDGVHSNLARRLAVAARFAPGERPLGQQFLEAYRAGFDAGAAHG